MDRREFIIDAIDRSPLNRGLNGAEWLDTPGNVAILHGDNLALFDDEGDGTYQVHFLYRNVKTAVADARASLEAMFNDHAADTIFGMTPVDLDAANHLARLAGGKAIGQRNTEFGVCNLYVLSRDMLDNGDDE